MNKIKKIYIGGNIYGAGNIGDDAVLQGIVLIIDKILPHSKLTIGTDGGRPLSYLRSDAEYVCAESMLDVSTALKQSDLFICGGGTMIGEEICVEYPMQYVARLIALSKYYGKRVVTLGIGANRLHSVLGVRMGKAICALSDVVTVRDKESRDVCVSLGASPEKTVVAADPAFLLKGSETARTIALKKRLRLRGKCFGVNMVNESWADQEPYKVAVAKVCDELYDRCGLVPVFFCNEVRADRVYDSCANAMTARFLKCQHELLDPVYYSPEEMIDIISSFEFVIGMRMHSLIFASLEGIPFVGISRIDKVDNHMRRFGFKCSGSVARCNSEEIIGDIERLLLEKETIREDIFRCLNDIRTECLINVDVLREFTADVKLSWRRISIMSLKLVVSGSGWHNLLCSVLNGDISFLATLKKTWFRIRRECKLSNNCL